ncbi:ABC transporter ATP-binding protein [Hamadaea tsunoensis]|uniref:ABC transporter ATP-binding protein n=1 Tax=Hamadaea tsunoensis TaxID=53368 RepID=UPI0004214C82|nr:oligopeptide/dipeptide ABC transporter ATP-binding protein [Hamadaea tsunoensis]
MIEARNITRTYRSHGAITGARVVPALRGVSFSLPKGGAVSFIGESGCGKTTLGKILTGIETFDGGELVVDGVELSGLSARRRAPYFRRIQMIHQDPYSALNPTRTIEQTLEDPLRMRARETGGDRKAVEARAAELLELVGLSPEGVLGKYPHQLSGGQRQRVVIARALTVDPEVLIADEAVSMIDVSMRLGILSLLRDLRTRLGISLVFITHDVATARYIGEDGELHVIYRGSVIESGPTDTIIQTPVHPYTQCLLSAIPIMRGLELPGPQRLVPIGSLDERTEDTGCLFAPRCPFATDECEVAQPALTPWDPTHQHACLHAEPRQVAAMEIALSQ